MVDSSTLHHHRGGGGGHHHFMILCCYCCCCCCCCCCYFIFQLENHGGKTQDLASARLFEAIFLFGLGSYRKDHGVCQLGHSGAVLDHFRWWIAHAFVLASRAWATVPLVRVCLILLSLLLLSLLFQLFRSCWVCFLHVYLHPELTTF
jgi:hypothetical protein